MNPETIKKERRVANEKNQDVQKGTKYQKKCAQPTNIGTNESTSNGDGDWQCIYNTHRQSKNSYEVNEK